MESATEPLQDAYSFGSFREPASQVQENPPMASGGLEETGIRIRPRQPQHPVPALGVQQGAAIRRIRLQASIRVGSSPRGHRLSLATGEGRSQVEPTPPDVNGESRPSSWLRWMNGVNGGGQPALKVSAGAARSAYLYNLWLVLLSLMVSAVVVGVAVSGITRR